MIEPIEARAPPYFRRNELGSCSLGSPHDILPQDSFFFSSSGFGDIGSGGVRAASGVLVSLHEHGRLLTGENVISLAKTTGSYGSCDCRKSTNTRRILRLPNKEGRAVLYGKGELEYVRESL